MSAPMAARGARGQPGATGPAGPQGARGPQGPRGATGPQGPVGPVGPAGPPGQAGADGRTPVFASRATVTTLTPGSKAYAQCDEDPDNPGHYTFLFGIPRGQDGLPATTPVASADAISLDAGNPATVELSAEAGVWSFKFGIPKGEPGQKGDTGPQGAAGPRGPTGPQGPAAANTFSSIGITIGNAHVDMSRAYSFTPPFKVTTPDSSTADAVASYGSGGTATPRYAMSMTPGTSKYDYYHKLRYIDASPAWSPFLNTAKGSRSSVTFDALLYLNGPGNSAYRASTGGAVVTLSWDGNTLTPVDDVYLPMNQEQGGMAIATAVSIS